MYITGDNQLEIVPFHDISFDPSSVRFGQPHSSLGSSWGRLRYAITLSASTSVHDSCTGPGSSEKLL